MDQSLLQRWATYKSRHNVRRLTKSTDVDFEFRGDRMGHPSNFAAVRFHCEPSEEFSFVATPKWPSNLSQTYVGDLENAVLSGLIDVLMTEEFAPYSGCSITLTDIKWDDISSSEHAYYVASKGAAKKLISGDEWE